MGISLRQCRSSSPTPTPGSGAASPACSPTWATTSSAVDAADAAVERCREQPPDVVLVDVELCRDDEQELLAALKGDPEAYRSAVVLLERPDLDLDTAVAALRRGVQDFLVEPIGDAELVARVEAAGRTKVLQEELVVQSERLEAMLFEDPLTGLSNRRFILTQLAGAISAARRHERPLTIAIVDIDHFKAVNDEHGHAAGDRVLAAVASALREHLRAEDQLGRLGGEEFLALVPDADAPWPRPRSRSCAPRSPRLEVEHDGPRPGRDGQHRLGGVGGGIGGGADAPGRRGAVRGQALRP